MSDRASFMDRNYLAVMEGALVWSLLGVATGHAQQPQSVIVVHPETNIGQALKEQRAEIATCRQILRRRAALDRFPATHDPWRDRDVPDCPALVPAR